MRKFLFSIILLASATVYTSAQVSASQNLKPADLSHWSIGVGGGVDYYQVAPSGYGHKNNASWAAPRISIEYSINPLFGIGIDGGYYAYNRSSAAGNTIDFTAYSSANLFNLLLPERTGFWGKVNVYGNLGAGFGLYHYKLAATNVSNNRNFSPVATLGLSAEYNLSKSWALDLESQCRAYTKEDLGGASTAQLTNEALVGTVSIRYKFGANSKNHARNISMCEYYPKPAPIIIDKIVKDNTIETINRLNALEVENDSIINQNRRLSEEMKALSNRNNKPTTTVIVKNDDALTDKIQKLENDLKELAAKNNGIVNASFDNIQFQSSSDKLTSNSYSTLDRIAEVLVRNPGWAKLNVSGHTDSSGSAEYNQKLSKNRANSVKNYLLQKNVPSASISVTGYGEDRPIASNNTDEGRQKNRRVEFQISK